MMLDLPLQQQEPLYYRTDPTKAVFAAELRRHQRRTTVAVSSQVVLSAGGARVEQKFVYSVAYEPTDYLLLQVPRELVAGGRLELSCDDQTLVPVPLGDESDSGAKPLRMRVGLPKSIIGRCDLTARYSLSLGASDPDPRAGAADASGAGAGGLRVPLVMPLEAELTGNVLTVVPSEEQQVEVVGSDWTAADIIAAEGEPGATPHVSGSPASGYPGYAAASARARAFTSTRPVSEAVLDLRGGSGDASVIVQRAWLQTRLLQSPSVRQDQLIAQFVTRRRRLEITLPPGAIREQAMVRLFLLDHDGTDEKLPNELPIVSGIVGDRGLTVPLPPSRSAGAPTGAGRYVISLQYRLPCTKVGNGGRVLTLPHFGDDAWVSQAYWQLLLPPQEHLAAAPSDFTGEFLWRWNNFYYGRQPIMSQAELEAWVGLPHPGNSPGEAGMNSYLFSALAWPDSCEIVTVGRSTIVLLASGAALFAGLALIYLRAARHPAVLLAVTIALAGGAARYPELALLSSQAAVLGLVLTLLAFVLRRWLVGGAPIAPLEVASSTTQSLRVPRPSESPTHSAGVPASGFPPITAASSSKAAIVPPTHSAGTPSDAVA
jgi:hypothetical protein